LFLTKIDKSAVFDVTSIRLLVCITFF